MAAFWKRTLGAVALVASTVVTAADFPSAPITIVVPVAADGAMDLAGRTLAPHIKEQLGQPMVIENKPRGSGNIAYTRVARAKADGHTLLFSYEGFHAGTPAVSKTLLWDPIKSFTPIAEVTRGPHVITVPKDFPAADLKSFIALARSGAQPLNYGSSGVGADCALTILRDELEHSMRLCGLCSVANIDAQVLGKPDNSGRAHGGLT